MEGSAMQGVTAQKLFFPLIYEEKRIKFARTSEKTRRKERKYVG